MFKRAWVYLKETPTWVWLVLFIVSAIITTQAMRHNNFQTIKLREAVYAADKSGENVDQALNNLRAYVYAHMNTELSSGNNAIKPPIQLKYTYDRLAKEQQAKLNAANEQILRDAAAYCAKTQSGQFRQVCVENYAKDRSVKAPKAIPAALYQFDFASPAWSPDTAGWGMVISVILGVITVISFTADRQAAFRLKHKNKN